MYYYYPPPPVYIGAPPSCGMPAVQLPVYANPTPAPPSASKEPTPGKAASPLPTVIESRSYTLNEKPPAKAADLSTKDVCKVGFWNVSAADIKVTVNDMTHMIPRNRNLTLTVNREFTYQVDSQTPQTERIPTDKTVHEIVVR